jgi:hypothetical protein
MLAYKILCQGDDNYKPIAVLKDLLYNSNTEISEAIS